MSHIPLTRGDSIFGRKFMLNNGVMLPAVGVGTFRVRSEAAVHDLVDRSLEAGYRMFDTASMYGNEVALKNAFANLLPKYKLQRSDIFITSKLISISKADFREVRRTLHRTLSNLGLEYLDLYLINYPTGTDYNRKKTWEALQRLYEERYVCAIGVSNYEVEHLLEITTGFALGPMVNQVEWHPLMHNDVLYRFCKKNDILLQAYSPFGTPFTTDKRLFYNQVIKKVAAKYEVGASQVILMWSLQQDVAVVPISTDGRRLRQNIRVQLLLSASDIQCISAIAPNAAVCSSSADN